MNEMHEWFKYLFEYRMDEKGFVECFECGKKMSKQTYQNNMSCYSHILEKSKYPELAGNEDNVVIVHPDCHNLYTMRPTKATNQYNLKQQLKEKYNV